MKAHKFDDEFEDDWKNARSGLVSFKVFADKWLPYLVLNQEREFRAQNIQLTDCWPPCA